MSNDQIAPPTPEMKINLGDKERTLRCDLHAMRLFKRETGVSLLKGELGGDDNPISEDNVPELFWAFAVHEDGGFTPDDAAKLIHPGNMSKVVEVITDLIMESLPDEEETEDDDEKEGGGDAEDPLAKTS